MHRLGAGLEQAVLELFVRDEAGELEQAGPHESSRADEVEECVLREHGPALALSTLEHFVECRAVTATTIRLAARPVKRA